MINWREQFCRIKRTEALSRILSIIDVGKISLSILFFVAIPWICGGVATRASWWCQNWWFLKWCMLAIGLWMIWKRKASDFSAEQDDLDEQCRLNSDAPIKRKEQDVLARGPLVAMLQELIKGFPVNDVARYIGLYAPWGDGKTSVINLLKERVNACGDRNHILFVEFEPWKYQSQENLSLVFFKRLSEQMMSRDREIGRRFAELARIIQLRYMGRYLGGVETVLNAINSLFVEQVWSESVIRAKLTALLVDNKQKIVVVIDDLDRLPKDDICRVIRFLKAHGDVPNVIYLIAADETYLANAVGEGLVPGNENMTLRGRKYLEKIIPISRQLPAISAEKLLEGLQKDVDKLLGEQFGNRVDATNLDLTIAIPYLDNIRSLKRLENALMVDLAFAKKRVGDDVYLGVDIGDFISLSILREFERDFYEKLPSARFKLQQAMGWPYKEHYVSEKWMEKHFWGLSQTEEGVENIKNFVLTRLGVKVAGKRPDQPKVYGLGYKDDADELLHYRLSSRLCFPGYFISEVEDVQLYQGVVNEFLSAISRKVFPDGLIGKLDEEGKLPFLMYMLESQNVYESNVVSEFFIRTLVRIGEMSLRPVDLNIDVGEITWRGLTIYERIFRCLFVYCRRLKMELHTRRMHGMCKDGEDHVGFVLLPILEEEGSVIMLERFIAMEGDEHTKEGSSTDWYFTKEEFSKMESLYVARIAKRQREDVAVNLTAFLNLFRSWMIILNRAGNPEWINEFAAANDRWLGDYSVLTIMLVFFTDDERAARDVAYAVAADMDRLYKYWTKEQVERIVRTLAETPNKDVRDELFLVAFKFAQSQKLHGDSYDKDTQFAYMKDHYQQLVEAGEVVE